MLFTENKIPLKNTKTLQNKILDLVNTINSVTGHTINIQKSVDFIHDTIKHWELN